MAHPGVPSNRRLARRDQFSALARRPLDAIAVLEGARPAASVLGPRPPGQREVVRSRDRPQDASRPSHVRHDADTVLVAGARQTAALGGDVPLLCRGHGHAVPPEAAHLRERLAETAAEEAVAQRVGRRVGEAEPLHERVHVRGDGDGARARAVQVEVDVDDVVRHPRDGERRDDGHEEAHAAASTARQVRRALARVVRERVAPPEDARDHDVGGGHREQRHDVERDEHRHVVRVLPVDVAPFLLARRHVHGVRYGLDGRVVDDDDRRRDDDGHEPHGRQHDDDPSAGEQQARLHRPDDGVQTVNADGEQGEHTHTHGDTLDERREFTYDHPVHPVAVDVGRQGEGHADHDDQQVAHRQVHKEHVRLSAHVRHVDDDGDDEQVAKETDDEGDGVEANE